ncbi:hypothetical protein GOZ89_24425 [Agrobacterium vitis]|uniref:hypothetical protein n=1 Tax=Agrobacterium vitis TaxID=373 RepID=UPI0012E73014|nr:hypothetical protein [Agrobacterium vitis]MVA82556.1 hypothetical protein [Agrobacterium vitis]
MLLEDITAILGPIDDDLVAQIGKTGASPGELFEAWAWLNADEALASQGRSPSSGKVAELIALIEAAELDDDAPF